jgi:hypothetical protein
MTLCVSPQVGGAGTGWSQGVTTDPRVGTGKLWVQVQLGLLRNQQDRYIKVFTPATRISRTGKCFSYLLKWARKKVKSWD